MEPVPTSLRLGPLTFHLYGIGLALAVLLAYSYAGRRLRRAGLDDARWGRFALAVLAASLVGARVAHVATNWSLYAGHPAQWLALWNGGLSSFGALATAIPVGLLLRRRWWPDTTLARFADAVVPALVAGWAVGRFLGPQFMYQGGGHLTHQWFGLRYAGQVGRRVPVPLIQGLEDGTLWLVLLALQRRVRDRVPGLVASVAMVVWGVVRTFDERWLLGQHSHSGSVGVQLAGIALAAAGVVCGIVATRRAGRARVSPAARSAP